MNIRRTPPGEEGKGDQTMSLQSARRRRERYKAIVVAAVCILLVIVFVIVPMQKFFLREVRNNALVNLGMSLLMCSLDLKRLPSGWAELNQWSRDHGKPLGSLERLETGLTLKWSYPISSVRGDERLVISSGGGLENDAELLNELIVHVLYGERLIEEKEANGGTD